MSRRYWFPKRYADTVMRLRVSSGFVLVAAFGMLSHPTLQSLAWSVPVSLAGLWLRAWAAGHLEKNRTLAASGPYAFTRNPLYLGTLLVAAGLAIASRQWILGLLFGAVFVFIYLPVIEQEEQHLRKIFPGYSEYADRVPLLIPTARPIASQGKFRWSVYRRNEEYQALFGYLAGLAFLLWRALSSK